jgi:hypothetical protein
MQSAINIGRYLIPHARAAYAEMGADVQVENAKYLLRWIERTAQRSFTKRDAHQAHKGRFKKVTEIEPALILLEAHGYISSRANNTDRRSGRRPSQVFDVNPFLFSSSHNSHNPQNPASEGNSEDCENCETNVLENFSGWDCILPAAADEDRELAVETEESSDELLSDEIAERAAIMEIDGGLLRAEAERRAREYTSRRHFEGKQAA